MTDYKIDEETAALEFSRFMEEYDLEFDVKEMGDEDTKEFEKTRERVIKAIRVGALVIGEDGDPTYTPQRKRSKYQTPLKFHERTGKTLAAGDGLDQKALGRRTNASIAELCDVRASDIAGLVGTDIKVCEALFLLLVA